MQSREYTALPEEGTTCSRSRLRNLDVVRLPAREGVKHLGPLDQCSSRLPEKNGRSLPFLLVAGGILLGLRVRLHDGLRGMQFAHLLGSLSWILGRYFDARGHGP